MVFERLDASLRARLFGDYPTSDGSCIRDNIHVADIADAHVAAARRLEQDTATELVLNIGRSEGTSVLEMLDVMGKVTGLYAIPAREPRRVGDSARVVASSELIGRELGWHARHNPTEMVASAWAGWRLRHGS